MHAPLVVFAGAAAAGHRLYDLDLVAVVVDDQMADVDDAEADAGMFLTFGGWVRWVRGRLIHVNTSCVLAAPPGD